MKIFENCFCICLYKLTHGTGNNIKWFYKGRYEKHFLVIFICSTGSGGAGHKQTPLKTVVPKAKNFTPSKHTGQCKINSEHTETAQSDLKQKPINAVSIYNVFLSVTASTPTCKPAVSASKAAYNSTISPWKRTSSGRFAGLPFCGHGKCFCFLFLCLQYLC